MWEWLVLCLCAYLALAAVLAVSACMLASQISQVEGG